MDFISDPAPRIGISACLLGAAVRFDGGHKRDPFLVETFGRFVEWVPLCPEVEAGLGTPRESMRLVRTANGVRVLTVRSRVDQTERLEAGSAACAARAVAADLSGYILKKDSPSCGLERVKVYDANGSPTRSGRGVFAARLLELCPSLPVEEEGRLSDPRLRDNFIERVFVYARLRALFKPRWSVGALVQFHTAHKFLVLAHSTEAYQALGQLVAMARTLPRDVLQARYTTGLMGALSAIATPRRHANVLQHLAGFLKERLDAPSKRELLDSIDEYRRGLVPLVVPITLLRHHVRVHQPPYLAGQTYLEPHPRELMLRNHV